MHNERPLASVPKRLIWALVAALSAQIAFVAALPKPVARAADLSPPPHSDALRLVSLGEPIAFGKILMLWLQAFDNQPGVSIPFAKLHYPTVIDWLRQILILDPDGQYPLLAASRLYGEVSVESKQRAMLAFVREEFLRDPNRRWRWMAHAIYIAKHRLHDLDLALQYAQDLSSHVSSPAIPSWAKQMHIFVLEDMGELEAAKVLLGGLLESGNLKSPHERRFLSQRLRQLEQGLSRLEEGKSQ